jgi:hypothetical protein
MTTRREAERIAFQRVPETCPAVDAAFASVNRAASDALASMAGIGFDAALSAVSDSISDATEKADGEVKEQTTALRKALIDALAEAGEARSAKAELMAPLKALRYALRWVDPSSGNREWSALMDAADEMAAVVERITW